MILIYGHRKVYSNQLYGNLDTPYNKSLPKCESHLSGYSVEADIIIGIFSPVIG